MAGHLMARCVISGFNRRLQMPDHAIHLCKGVGAGTLLATSHQIVYYKE